MAFPAVFFMWIDSEGSQALSEASVPSSPKLGAQDKDVPAAAVPRFVSNNKMSSYQCPLFGDILLAYKIYDRES